MINRMGRRVQPTSIGLDPAQEGRGGASGVRYLLVRVVCFAQRSGRKALVTEPVLLAHLPPHLTLQDTSSCHSGDTQPVPQEHDHVLSRVSYRHPSHVLFNQLDSIFEPLVVGLGDGYGISCVMSEADGESKFGKCVKMWPKLC